MKNKRPIMVSKEKPWSHREGEKFYKIYCLAPFTNAFNEVIEVRYTETSFMNNKKEWQVSKATSGSMSPEEATLVAEGFQIALKLIAGDESVVSDPNDVKKFQDAYWRNLKKREKARRERRAA